MLEQEALAIFHEDIEANQKIGIHGREIVPDKATIMTICNTGSLATAGYGTAFGVIRAAAEAGKKVLAVSCETRPLLQGSRLTAWELQKNNIPFVLITDSMAGYYMKKKGVDLVIIGADRIAANGDSANKIGSYSLAILAHQHNIPFYVAAPTSTIDPDTKQGDDIPIEERNPEEITHIGNQRIAPDGVTVWNPAFDVVPFAYMAGIITEKGIIKPPYQDNIREVLKKTDKKTDMSCKCLFSEFCILLQKRRVLRMKKVEKIWMDGTLVNWDDAKVHVLTHTLHYGLGVFEGIRCYQCHDGASAVFRLKEHIDRLFESAVIGMMTIPFTREQLCSAVIETLKINKLKEA